MNWLWSIISFTTRTSGRSIDARVIFVFSTADRKVIREQREKQIGR